MAQLTGAFVVAVFGLTGCAGEVGSSDPSSVSVGSSPSSSSAAQPVVAAKHPRRADGDTCSPLECCFPTRGAAGRTTRSRIGSRPSAAPGPAPYQETGGDFWAWTACPFNLDLIETVLKYSGTPYDAQFVENPCLGFELGKVNVIFEFDLPDLVDTGVGVGVGVGVGIGVGVGVGSVFDSASSSD